MIDLLAPLRWFLLPPYYPVYGSEALRAYEAVVKRAIKESEYHKSPVVELFNKQK